MDLTESARLRMVTEQLEARSIRDGRVLAAMRRVPRHEFVPASLRSEAYVDAPLPIGHHQTISQPYIVALMVEALRIEPTDRVLEVGTGSGYAAAVMAELAREVITVERHIQLADSARLVFARLGITNVQVHVTDGTLGWSRSAPYDAIAVTASGPRVPQALADQLVVGGRLVIPVGDDPSAQRLLLVERQGERTFVTKNLCLVRFVPLVGEQGWADE